MRRLGARGSDGILAAALAAAAEFQFWFARPPHLALTGTPWLVAALYAVSTGAVAWRRTRPVEALVAAGGSWLIAEQLVGNYPNGGPLAPFLAVVVAFYSHGAYAEGTKALRVGIAALGVLAVLDAARSGLQLRDGLQPGASLVLGVAWVVGAEVGRRRREVTRLRAQAAALEAEREQNARAAVAEERARIARELHDVVAHSVSVMVVQAQAGPRLLRDHDAASDAFGSIEQVGRGALVELRRLLGVLRTDNQQPATAPQPGLGSLTPLLEQVRASGVPVSVSVGGEPVRLPPGIELSAYRIVQEALTNTIKHAGPATAEVVIRYGTYVLEIEVRDDGNGPTAVGDDVGHGLIGMRERVAIYGGELESGARPGGGFHVRARLPINGVLE